MSRDEFKEKYSQIGDSSTEDVLMRIASNLSDLQHNTSILKDRIDMLKEYIFDYKSVIKNEKLDI
jgi:hypothetical protein